MLRRRTLLLFLLAIVLRLLLQGWDIGVTSSSSHPDERQVGFVTEKAEGWFADPGFYAYGSLHFHVIRFAAYVLGLGDELRGLIVSGRVISLVGSMIAIFLGWLIASRAWGRRTGDLFIFLVAWVPLDLQQSHFTTVEAHHTAWVMAALAACFWLASRGRAVAAIAAGAAIGASLAVKVASLALVLPLIVAVVVTTRGREPLRALRLLATAGAAGMAGFWLCQPWAFADGRPPISVILSATVVAIALAIRDRRNSRARGALLAIALLLSVVAALQMAALVGVGGAGVTRLGSAVLAGAALNPEYLEGVGNEVAMVVGSADVAYVRVYAHTLPVLYPLRELGIWGWGLPLLLATLAGVVAGGRWLARRRRRWFARRWDASSTLLVILLAWFVPMALRLSTLQVKFLRYWEPLVVPAALVASWWLLRLPRKVRSKAVLVAAAGTALWGLAYSWSFIDPHPHRTASEWIGPMLADQQVVAFEHWDEHIALHLADGGTAKLAELPSYNLPEDDEKIATWTTELARSDWVVLTSNRVYRTVLANPDRFQKTARLYRLLLAGEAGFEVLTRVGRGPRIFGLRWPVQRADESFLNYEFPQVVILRRVATIDPERLADRVSRPLPFLEQMGYAELERHFLNHVPALPPVPSRVRQVVDLATWMVVFVGLGCAAWTLLLPLLGRLPDAGVGLALTSGWIAPAWLLWMGSELRIWKVGPTTATWVFLALLASGGVAAVARWSTIVATIRKRTSTIVAVLSVAAAIGALFLLIRAWNPAIYWGEKPMDFSFLNAFLRAPQWPPGEPWMAGMPLHYYYFGEILAAFPMLIAGCSSGVGYNLISATIPALFGGVLAGLGLLLTRRRVVVAATVLPVLVLLTGNLAWPWLVTTLSKGNLFDMWWATSRVIPGFAIDEYPLWTTLFADLHGHFIAFPVLVTVFAWGWLCVTVDDRRWMIASTLCGICAAVVVATNPWDLFILTSTLAVGVAVAARHPIRGLLRLGAAAVVSVVAAAPFIVELVAGISAGAGERGLFLTDADFAPAWAIFRHFGLFLIPLTALAMTILGRRFWLVVPTAAVGIIAGLSFRSSAAALALAVTAVFATVAARSRHRLDRLGWSLAALGTLAVAACERFTLIDRMNTIFKVYNGVWVLLAFALTAALLRCRGRRRAVVVTVWVPLQLVALANLPLGIAQGWILPRIPSPRPTLDGQAFLANEQPQTWFLVRRLQGVARPGETVAEAAGPYYSDFTRITMHTGQPTVVGWDWHLKQRGQPDAEISARFDDLDLLYSGSNREKRRAVLDRYRVAWAVAARVEREQYKLSAENPLGDIPGVQLTAQRDGAVLYRVLPSEASDTQTAVSGSEAPPGMSIVGRLQDPGEAIVRGIAIDESGATAIMRGGGLVELDLQGRQDGVLQAPPCEPTGVARNGEERWAACREGQLWHSTGKNWNSIGGIAGADRIAAARQVWAWGPGGLWRYLGESRWRQINSAPVTAAAARADRIAWSSGSRIWIGAGAERQQVGESLTGVSALAWQGEVLWALDKTGLYRMGGDELPQRRILEKTDDVVTIAGGPISLWVVRDDGVVFEPERPMCPPPWSSQGTARAGSLREPRGLAVSPAGWFVVADTFNHRVLWYTDEGRCLDAVGVQGSGPREFREPAGVALASDGSLAVADTWNGRIQILRTDGTTKVFGRNLFGPRDLIWTPGGSLLVSDTGNRKLLRFSPPEWKSQTVARLPGPPVGLEWVDGLVAVAVPADGAVILVDPSDGSVVRRIELACWNNQEQQEGYLALLPSGNLVASSPHFGELWLVDPTGEEPPRLLVDGLTGVTAIALTPSGELLASLTWENRLVRVPVEE